MLCILAQTIINLAWHRDKNYVFVQILLAAAQIESEGERWRGGEIDCTLAAITGCTSEMRTVARRIHMHF